MEATSHGLAFFAAVACFAFVAVTLRRWGHTGAA
jgi:hypothetical protein